MKIKYHFLILLFYSFLTVIATYPQIRHMKQGIYSLSDQLFYAWMIERNIESVLHKPLSEFFNASIFFPYENTLAFGDHMLGETFLASPFYLATGNPVFAENVLILASFVLSAYGMFFLVKYHTNNLWAALLGGVLFSFSNVRFNQYDHLNIISTQWLPFIFLFLHRYLEQLRKKDLVLLSLFYFLTILLTIYYFIMVSLVIFVYVAIWMLIKKIPISRVVGKLLLLCGALGVCIIITIPTLLPYLKFSRDFPEARRVIQDNIIYSANLVSFLTTARTTIYSQISGLSKESESNGGLFPGFVLLYFTGVSIFLVMKDQIKRNIKLFFGIISGTCFVLSFGPLLKLTSEIQTSLPLPYFYLYYSLLPFQIMRVPARFVIFAQLFLVVFASYGIVQIFNSLREQNKKYITIGILIIAVLVETYSGLLPITLVETKKDFPAVYHWLKNQPADTTVLELPIPVNQPTVESTKLVRHAFMENLSIRDKDNIESYRNYFSLLHGKRIVNGYSAYAPEEYKKMIEGLKNFPNDESMRTIRNLDIDYVIVHTRQYSPELKKNIELQFPLDKTMQVVEQFENDYVLKVL